MMLDPGTRFGPYVVTAPVATGGMGAVFLARDTRLDRPVALKVLRDDRRSASERARVEREARILAQLTHPRICTLLDIVQTDDDTVLVMEALDGDTLADRVARNGRRGLAVDECLAIAADVSEGLAYAHRHGVVHGDVKPSNIMLTAAGAKLLDFGIAHLRTGGALSAATDTATTDALLRAGTLQYMAPEQLDGRADARSDLFALGAVLFEMLTGIRAFEGATTSDVIARILGGDRPKLPETVDPSIGRIVRGVSRSIPIAAGSPPVTSQTSSGGSRSSRLVPLLRANDREAPFRARPCRVRAFVWRPGASASSPWRASSPFCSRARRPRPMGVVRSSFEPTSPSRLASTWSTSRRPRCRETVGSSPISPLRTAQRVSSSATSRPQMCGRYRVRTVARIRSGLRMGDGWRSSPKAL
ncbi:MAG: serine/threonine-protein kinase [Vicinamibacterales bacterium]